MILAQVDFSLGPAGWAWSAAVPIAGYALMELGGLKSILAWPRWVFGVTAVSNNALVSANQPDLGLFVTVIGGTVVTAVGIYVAVMKTITSSRIEREKAWDEARKASLSGQIEAMKDEMAAAAADHKEQLSRLESRAERDAAEHREQLSRIEARAEEDAAEARESIAHARKSLHDLRDEAHVEQLRLKGQIAELTKELHAMRVENRRLAEAAGRAAKRTEERLDRIDPGSSQHDLPVRTD